jgi:hypothetical protein
MTGNGNGNGAGSHLAWIRQRHEALSVARTLDKPVPGYQGRLVLRFTPVPWPVVARVQSLIGDGQGDRNGATALNANCDVVIAACAAVLVDGESIDPSGDVRRIDTELAELLGSETTTARDTLLWLFPSELAVSMLAGEVLQWMSSAGADVAGELVGE